MEQKYQTCCRWYPVSVGGRRFNVINVIVNVAELRKEKNAQLLSETNLLFVD